VNGKTGMKRVDNQFVADTLWERVASGHHVDSRLLSEIRSGQIFSITFEDQDSFLSLIWQEIDDSRLLTPEHEPRTLKDVAMRLIHAKHTIDRLGSEIGLPPRQHNPAWFQKCIPIANSFSYEAFGSIALVPANDSERAQSPSGTFYIYDGLHKTLVLSALLLRGLVSFQPLEAILLTPRRL
jgi:hypothetical protein